MARYLTAAVSFLAASLWTNSAFALCIPFIGCFGGGEGGGRGPTAVPEIDASGAFAAVALVLSVGMITYRRLQKR